MAFLPALDHMEYDSQTIFQKHPLLWSHCRDDDPATGHALPSTRLKDWAESPSLSFWHI